MDILTTTVTVSDMYEIVECSRETCKFEYTTYSKWKLEESIRQTQIYLVNLRSFKSNCIPSAKRLKYAKTYGRFQAIPESDDSEDYTDISSDDEESVYNDDELDGNGKPISQKEKNTRFMKKNVINFLKFMNLVPIVDLGFRKPSTVHHNVAAPCICPFHAKFLPLCERILPDHITNADVFCNPSCTSK